MTTDARTTVALLAQFRTGLYLPDPGLFYVTLAAVAANKMPGDPTLLLIIAPPSGGKTEMLNSLSQLSDCHTVDTLTEAGLLAGTTSRDGTGTGGILRQVGEEGLLVSPDFSTLLGSHPNARGTIFAALRRVADGYYTRVLGTDGGRTVSWEGKCGFLAAVTEYIDSPDVTMGQLGERFARYRLPKATVEDDLTACALAADLTGQEMRLRSERAEAVRDFFAGLPIPDELPALTADEYERINTLATIGVRLRSATVRDGRSREVVLVPQAERPMRLLRILIHLYAGFSVIGCPSEEKWHLLAEIALGGAHPGPRAIVEFLLGERQAHTTAVVAARCRVPKTSAARYLEDLNAHEVVDLIGDMPQVWSASDWLRRCWWAVRCTDPSAIQAPSRVTEPAAGPEAF